jgi:glucose/arabinose dehydrogenase
MRTSLGAFILGGAGFLFVGCSSGGPALAPQATFGPNPVLPPPRNQSIPVVNIAPRDGWGPGQAPVPAAGLQVSALATGLDHPRWLLVLPNGDVLVAETNRPPEKGGGLMGMIMGAVMKKAGAGVPSANRITLLRDADGDGVAEVRTSFLSGLYHPFGMALAGGDLYVANADGIVRFPYRPGQTQITAQPVRVTDLPGGPRNHHWTKNVVAAPDGRTLFAAVGSNSNVAEHGMAEEAGRAAIWRVDRATGEKQLFATGLRNPVGMDFVPQTGWLWTSVNERDTLGIDLVPDYMTSVREGGFYGWPYSYYGQNVDVRPKPPRPDLVARAIKPDYALGAHTASLGLTFYKSGSLPARYWGGAFVGQHGSWNREPRSGYQVIFVPFAGGQPAGPPEVILSGFVNANGHALGRPVGVAVAKDGALLVADDVGNVVWRVTAAPGRTARR